MKKVKIRTLLIGGAFTLFFLAVLVRIYWIQVVEAHWLVERAEQVWQKSEVLKAKRGSILDRNGEILAEDGPSYTVILDPKKLEELNKRAEVVRELSKILGKPEPELMELATKKRDNGNYYTWVEVRNEGWKIDSETADLIKERFQPYTTTNYITTFSEYGLYLEENRKRYYPSGQLAAHLLGYFNKNEEPVMGLEMLYDHVLKGTSGKIVTEKDLKGNELPNAKVTYEPAIDGNIIKLTIDKQIQSYIESALDHAYEQWKPKSMTVIAVDPNTMEVLGMANRPSFDPNRYWQFNSHGDFFNHAVGSQYEPGSTFKIVTLAAAVEEGIFNPEDTFMSGRISVPGATLHDHDRGWGQISYLEGLKRSSNVAFVKLGYEMLGGEKLREYIHRFGFGQKTGIDLPGEVNGVVNFKFPAEIATTTYGQGGIAATTIQQVAAFAAIANGGKLMTPYVVKEVIDSQTNEVIRSNGPKVVRQVISESSARQVSEYLEQVVADQKIGTGRNAYIEGYRIAGKTGTANKVIGGKYSPDRWVVSFIGYAPVENPKILIAVIADEPDLNNDYREGGKVTLPVFKEIMSQSLRYLGVSSKVDAAVLTEKEIQLTVPDLEGLSVQAAQGVLGGSRLQYEILGEGNKVQGQFPEPGTQIGPMQRIYILTEKVEHIRIPDFKGKSLRDAMEMCTLLNLACEASGEGYVAKQSVHSNQGKPYVVLRLEPLSASLSRSSPDGQSDPEAEPHQGEEIR